MEPDAGLRAVAVDIGSVKPPGRFAWAVVDAPGDKVSDAGDDPEGAVTGLVDALQGGSRVALALECPLTVPVPSGARDQWRLLGQARRGEGNRAWSAGAGAYALATGLAQGAWICDRVVERVGSITATTSVDQWHAGSAQLLLAEAFVSADGKPVAVPTGQHAADAAAAAILLWQMLSGGVGQSDITCAPHGAFNLMAAMALRAGLKINPDEQHGEILVVKVKPERRDAGIGGQ
jgi:hypothetical protein